MKARTLFAELKRRNVYKVAIAYAIVAWLLIQIATQVFPFFENPNWAIRLVIMLLVLGFPVALVLSLAYELTPEGEANGGCRAPRIHHAQHRAQARFRFNARNFRVRPVCEIRFF